jgi:hypothetical protein
MGMESAYLTALVHGEPRPVKRGIEWDLEVKINIPVGRGENSTNTIFRQIFTMLEFSSAKSNHSSRAPDRKPIKTGIARPIGQISLSRDAPLEWAALSKDYNLIHLSATSARLFGLPGKLAHGNHVVGKALQQLPQPQRIQSLTEGPTCMVVEFKKPMVVPGEFDVELSDKEERFTRLTVSRQGKTYLTAEYGSFQSP